jgi:hypothetical protein
VGVGEMKEIGVLLHVTLLGRMIVCLHVVVGVGGRDMRVKPSDFLKF